MSQIYYGEPAVGGDYPCPHCGEMVAASVAYDACPFCNKSFSAPPAAPSVQADSGSETLPTSKEAAPEGQMTLLPCPFCGKPAKLIQLDTGWRVECGAIGACYSNWREGYQMVGAAAGRWNMRAPTPPRDVTTSDPSSVSALKAELEENRRAAKASIEAIVQEFDRQLAASRQREEKLREALGPFAQAAKELRLVGGAIKPDDQWLWKPSSNTRETNGISAQHLLDAQTALK